MTREREWIIQAVFQHRDQAKAAAQALAAIQPYRYTLSVVEDGEIVWQERGARYGVDDVRV